MTTGFHGAPRAEKTCGALRFEIEQGRFAQAEMLPGERDLAQHLGVSRTTLRRAIGHLIDDGLLYQRQGFGTYVRRTVSPTPSGLPRPPTPGPHISGYVGFPAEVARRGLVPSFRDATMRLGLASPSDIMRLAPLAIDDPVWLLTRTILADGTPLALERLVVPAAGLPRTVLDQASSPIDTAYAELAPGRILQRTQSVRLDGLAAEQLELKENTTGLFIERLLLHRNGHCSAVATLIHHPERFDVVQDMRFAAEPASPVVRDPVADR